MGLEIQDARNVPQKRYVCWFRSGERKDPISKAKNVLPRFVGYRKVHIAVKYRIMVAAR